MCVYVCALQLCALNTGVSVIGVRREWSVYPYYAGAVGVKYIFSFKGDHDITSALLYLLLGAGTSFGERFHCKNSTPDSVRNHRDVNQSQKRNKKV